ncbi:unnamed protein product [Brachionus calyciflorus]|uniref:Uncharacterized protein n=1 Tax=Brachionus calyciflorus TaxID=104777 RepID=A0A814L6H9_9BILA|nr:unnamed protein product [Brachionus calyciflorus]
MPPRLYSNSSGWYAGNKCAKSELDLFMTPSTNTSKVSGGWFEINPTSSLSVGTSIEFRYEGSTNKYLQLSRKSLYLQVSIYKDKVLVTGDEATAPIKNFLHSLFSQVELSFNGQSFENSNNVYPYKAYITDLLNYGQDSKNSYLQSNLFYRDDAGRFDIIGTKGLYSNTKGDANFVANSGYVKRNKILNSVNGKIELIGRLHCDIFNTDRYLISNVSMNLKLIPTRPEFSQIEPFVMLGHALALEKTTAKYPIKRVVVKQHTIGKGVSSKVITNISSTSLPSRVVIGFVKNSAYDGVLDQNPFNFGHCNLTKLNLMADEQSSRY